MNIQELIQKHGKQLIGELIDRMIICKDIDKEELRLLLIKYRAITRATKSLRVGIRHYKQYEKLADGKYGYNEDMTNIFLIKNGSGRTIINIIFHDSELKSILEMLK